MKDTKDIYSETLGKLATLLTFSITQGGELVVTLNHKDYVMGEVKLIHGFSSHPNYLPSAFLDATQSALGMKDMKANDLLCECVGDLLDERMEGSDGLDIQIQAFFACRPWLKQ